MTNFSWLSQPRTRSRVQQPVSLSRTSSQKVDDLIDVNEIRDPAIGLYGLANADVVYTIYHDETNNIRRPHVRSDGLNVRTPKCFVLGGVARRGPPQHCRSMIYALRSYPEQCSRDQT